MRAGLYLAIGWVLLGMIGCGAAYPDLVKRRAELATLKKANKGLERKVSRYDNVSKRARSQRSLSISTKGVLKIVQAFHPLTVDGARMVKKRVKGKLTLARPKAIEILSPTQIRYGTLLSGKNVSVSLKGVPFAGAKDERQLKESLRAGAKIVVDSKVWLDRQRGALWIESQCVSLKLNKHHSKRNSDYLKELLNKRIYNVPKVVALPKDFVSKRASLMIASDGIVILNPE
ncbi:MAG: hypothetical protein ACPGQS_08015 [Bradymonadia bacterium]